MTGVADVNGGISPSKRRKVSNPNDDGGVGGVNINGNGGSGGVNNGYFNGVNVGNVNAINVNNVNVKVGAIVGSGVTGLAVGASVVGAPVGRDVGLLLTKTSQ